MTSEPLRLLADAGISGQIVKALRHAGYDVIHVRDVGLGRADDSLILNRAAAELRTLITFDRDFGEMSARASAPTPGVLFIRLRNARNEPVLRRIRVALATCGNALRDGAIVVVNETRVRVRRRPEDP